MAPTAVRIYIRHAVQTRCIAPCPRLLVQNGQRRRRRRYLRRYKTAKAFFQNESHGLYRRAPYGDQLVIPESLRERILTLEHQATVSAHPGMNRMYYAMRRRYFWPSMVTDIYNTITKCTTCAQNWLSLRRRTSPLTLFPATEPLTDPSVDIFGPVPATKAGNRFILVITDRFSKLTKCVALRRITAISVASAIIDAWVACYGPPDRILSDQGPLFMSNFFIAVMKCWAQKQCAPRHTTHRLMVKSKGTIVPWLRNSDIPSQTTRAIGVNYSPY